MKMTDEPSHSDRGANRDMQIGGDSFFEKLQAEERERQEIAKAFKRETTGQTKLQEVRDTQQLNARRISELNQSIGELRYSIRATQILVALLAIGLIGFAAYVSTRPHPLTQLPPANSSAGSTNGSSTTGFDPATAYPPDFSTEFEIRTDVDRKYQLVIRELHNNVRQVRRPEGPLDVRNAATEDYIRYMANVSRVTQEAVAERASEQIIDALVNLSLVGPESFRTTREMDLSIESQNRLDQIREVLRARDVRKTTSGRDEPKRNTP